MNRLPIVFLAMSAYAFAGDAQSAHPISGELTMVDHVNRMGILRPDRSDRHNKYHWDLPHHFTMLPEGRVYRCGSPATLKDIPVGTHLHGLFFLGEKGDYTVPLLNTEYAQKVANDPNDFSPESSYSQVLRLEDDFTYDYRRNVSWHVISIDYDELKLVAMGSDVRKTFDFTTSTDVWKGSRLVEMNDLRPADEILFNLEWATLFGPGRLTEIWVGKESWKLAAKRQHRRYIQHLRNCGFPAQVEHVEHLGGGKGKVTIRFYQGPSLADFAPFKPDTSGKVAVVEPNLRPYRGASLSVRFLEVRSTKEPQPGFSGLSAKFHTHELLEGIRPGRSIRVYPSGWIPTRLPREEELSPFDIRPRFLEVDPRD